MKKNFRSRGFIFVISSPSGCGKTTLAKMLLKSDSNLKQSISVTTRPKREGEVNGKDYFFIDEEKYHQMVGSDLLLEHAKVFKNFYGTPKEYVEDLLKQGKDVVCVIDWQGGLNLLKNAGRDTVSVFILPPSLKSLESRLNERGTDSGEVINHRLAEAKHEISKCQHYDYIVINDKLDACADQLAEILHSERLKRSRQDISQLILDIEKE
jgi:guanylate kinase